MPCTRITEKSEYLHSHLPGAFISGFSDILYSQFPPGSEQRKRFSSLFKYLERELLYPLVRHRIWLKNPMFRRFYGHFIREILLTDDLLSEEISDIIFSFVTPVLQKEEPSEQTLSETEFLLYSYIFTLSHPDCDNMVEEMGLGASLLQNLLRMSRTYARIKNGQNEVVFSADDPDYLYVEALEQLASMKASCPFYADVKRLSYLLTSIPSHWKGPVENLECCSYILNFLASIGTHSTSLLSLQELADKWVNEAPGRLVTLNPGELLSYLQEKEIIYFFAQNHTGAGKLHKTYAGLTELGYELTANVFGISSGEKGKPCELFRAATNPLWQRALVKARLRQEPERRQELLQSIMKERHVPGLVLELVVREWQGDEEQKQIKAWLQQVLSGNPLPSERKLICSLLAGLSGEGGERETLMSIAENDRNKEVRDHAGELIRTLSGF